jgi:hypothetical protein
VNPIFAAAVEVEACCHDHSFPFCFIGGVAVQRWGQPRLTADVDLTLLTGFGNEEPFVDVLLRTFRGRLADTREFALRNRTVLLAASNGIHVDVSLGALPFEEHSVQRASLFSIGEGLAITTCSAEDLVIHKVFAARDKDWGDVQGIVTRQGRSLDRQLVLSELVPLLELKEDSTSEERLREIFRSSRVGPGR